MAPASLHDIPPMDLRHRAATRLGSGRDPAATGMQATRSLAALHALASSPDTAADALALLHELQVHQVELELQAEELRDARIELEAALHRQTALNESLPVACLGIDRQLVIRQINGAAVSLLGVDPGELRGRTLSSCLVASGALAGLVGRLDALGRASGPLRWRHATGAEQDLHAEVGRDPSGDGHIVVLVALPDPGAPGGPESAA